MGRVEGKVAFITGAARGQGRSHAINLAREGADIIAVDICKQVGHNNYPLATPEDLARTVKEVESLGRRIVARQADVSDKAALQAAVDEGVAELGRLDIVVAQAGISPLGADVPIAVWFDVVQTCLVGTHNAITVAYPHLGPGASIIATGSVAGLMEEGGTQSPAAGPGGAGYGHAKRGIATLVTDLALTLGPQNIRVNAVHPSNVNTDMLHNEPMYRLFRPDLEHPTREDVLPAFQSLQALPTPYIEAQDVSNAVVFLASDESRYVTGLQFKVDAGALLKPSPF
jgi:SDR family mycofactocin-dependent oxidoreductase